MRVLATLVFVAFLMPGAAYAQEGETIDQALCRMIEGAAGRHHLPVDFFTRLIWQESSFRPHVTSGAGAQGVAQFMPGPARRARLASGRDAQLCLGDYRPHGRRLGRRGARGPLRRGFRNTDALSCGGRELSARDGSPRDRGVPGATGNR